MKHIKLFNLQNGHYYAIGEPYNFIREGDKWRYVGLQGRVDMLKWMALKHIDVDGVYSEDCYENAF